MAVQRASGADLHQRGKGPIQVDNVLEHRVGKDQVELFGE